MAAVILLGRRSSRSPQSNPRGSGSTRASTSMMLRSELVSLCRDALAVLPEAGSDGGKQQSGPEHSAGRVGPAPLSAGPPSEPDVRLSPHPAQACPPGRLARRPPIRPVRGGSSAGPFITAIGGDV
jgi:hypothetical protein